jgi:hypothetical protein
MSSITDTELEIIAANRMTHETVRGIARRIPYFHRGRDSQATGGGAECGRRDWDHPGGSTRSGAHPAAAQGQVSSDARVRRPHLSQSTDIGRRVDDPRAED